eukprot:333472-Prymnesium_polylepis.1
MQLVEAKLLAQAVAQPAKRAAARALVLKRRVALVLSRHDTTFIDLSIDAPQLSSGLQVEECRRPEAQGSARIWGHRNHKSGAGGRFAVNGLLHVPLPGWCALSTWS